MLEHDGVTVCEIKQSLLEGNVAMKFVAKSLQLVLRLLGLRVSRASRGGGATKCSPAHMALLKEARVRSRHLLGSR